MLQRILLPGIRQNLKRRTAMHTLGVRRLGQADSLESQKENGNLSGAESNLLLPAFFFTSGISKGERQS